jgi:hypothetical protein
LTLKGSDDEDDDEVVSSCKTAPVTGISNDKKEEEQEDSPNGRPLTLKGSLTWDSILKKRGAGGTDS